MATDFTYVPTIPQTVGVMAELTLMTGLVNSLSTYWMEKITKGYIMFHVLALISSCVALLAMAQPSYDTSKHTAKYVFTNVDGASGWSPMGFSFLFGFLSVSWTMTGMQQPSLVPIIPSQLTLFRSRLRRHSPYLRGDHSA